MKSVMVDGPRSGEVLTADSPLLDIVCFAIPVTLPMPWEKRQDMTKAPMWSVARYQRIGRVVGKDGAIDVYEFLGMR